MVKVDLIKKSRRKTLSMKIDKDGKLIVYAPLYCSNYEIEKFVLSHENWVEKHQKSVLNTNEIYSTKNLKIGDYIYLLGEKYQLVLGDCKHIEICEKKVILPANCLKNIENAIKKWIIAIAKEYLYEVLNDVAKRCNFSDFSFSLTYARGKWGSCSKKREIMLNFRLMCCPKNVIEYVATHELVHLKYMNHGKDFHSTLNYLCDDSKYCEKWLKTNSGILSSY